MIAFVCPHCDSALVYPAHQAGAEVKCLNCYRRIGVPTSTLDAGTLALLIHARQQQIRGYQKQAPAEVRLDEGAHCRG